MKFTASAEHLAPVMRQAWRFAAGLAILGTLLQLPVLAVGFGPVIWANLLGCIALGIGVWLGRQTWRRQQAGPRLDVELKGTILSTQWAGEDKQALSIGPGTKLQARRGHLSLQEAGTVLLLPLTLPGIAELETELTRLRFGSGSRALRQRHEERGAANDVVTPPELPERLSRAFAWSSLVSLVLLVAGGLIFGFDVGLTLFGGLLFNAAGFLFFEKGLIPWKTGFIAVASPYSGRSEHKGGLARFMAGLNMTGSVVLAILGLLLVVTGLGALLS